MSTGILLSLDLPDKDEFDTNISMILTKKRTKFIKNNPKIYKLLYAGATFDYLDNDTNMYYPLTFRVLRFKITDDTYETIITNLDADKFPPKKLKNSIIYAGI